MRSVFSSNAAIGLLALFIFIKAPLVAADEQPQLNVYTYDSFVSEWGPGPALKKAFELQCDCELNFIPVEDGISILNRARIEKGQTSADLLLGLDNGLITETRFLGLVQPHGIDTSSVTDELEWQDSYFVPFDYGYFAFIYNSDRISEPATSLKELIESDASVIYQDPRTSTPGQGLMTWINQVYADQASVAWSTLADHTLTVTKGWWEAYSMFLEGGSDYVLSYTTSPAYHAIVEDETRYKAAEFSEGHIAQIEVAAISAYSEQKELAQRFLEFLLSTQAQEIIPVTNWMLPVVDDVALPEAFDQLIYPKTIKVSNEEIAAQRADWIRVWRTSAQ